jgi:arylsulfatase A
MQSVVSFAVREENWKLCLCPGSGTLAKRLNIQNNAKGNTPSAENAWKRALNQFPKMPTDADLVKAPFIQLFDLANDPHEDHNLATDHPKRVRAMVALLRRQVELGRSTPGPELKNDRNVKLVNANDKRLPAFVRERLEVK